MKKTISALIICFALLPLQNMKAQDVYPVSSGELLFQFSNTELDGLSVDDQVRFTMFLHFGEYWHLDIGNNLGLFSGIALRNVGFIYDEDTPVQKTVRRSYTLGVPIALKIGSFSNHFYLFGGGEYELLFHYKGKRWYSHDRKGTKIKDTEWFSDKTNLFVPSVFAGIQFPGGINVKFKYYLDDFLNLDHVGKDFGEPDVSFASFTKHEMFYISVSWQLRTDKIRNKFKVREVMACK